MSLSRETRDTRFDEVRRAVELLQSALLRKRFEMCPQTLSGEGRTRAEFAPLHYSNRISPKAETRQSRSTVTRERSGIVPEIFRWGKVTGEKGQNARFRL
jgi:hypothetical protein